jgi:hypothetical protein
MWMVYSRATTSWMADRPDFCLDDIAETNGLLLELSLLNCKNSAKCREAGLTERFTVSWVVGGSWGGVVVFEVVGCTLLEHGETFRDPKVVGGGKIWPCSGRWSAVIGSNA